MAIIQGSSMGDPERITIHAGKCYFRESTDHSDHSIDSLTPETFTIKPVLARLQVPVHLITPPPCLSNTTLVSPLWPEIQE